MPKYLISFTLLYTLLGCGGGDSPDTNQTNNTNTPAIQNQHNDTTSPSTKNEPDTDTTTPQSTDVLLHTCIQENVQTHNKTTRTLETLSCANLRDREFALLATLPALSSLRIVDTTLSADDINMIQNSIKKEQITTLILENDNLNKAIVDGLDPTFTYDGAKRYTAVRHVSFKNNQIEGLKVVDFFPNTQVLNLEGNRFPEIRLHHVGATKTLIIANNPNIKNLNDFANKPLAEASIERIDISSLPALQDISELRNFSNLSHLIIDVTQQTRFHATLANIQSKGVEITTRQ